MGMSNEEIEALMKEGVDTIEEDISVVAKDNSSEPSFEISQEDMNNLLESFVSEEDGSHESLIEEIHEAILDSGRLSLMQWVSLREKLREIETLIPHIDLLIRLKSKVEKKRTDF